MPPKPYLVRSEILTAPPKRCAFPKSSNFRPLDRRRLISTYGYTQAKALVYPRHGAPRDVLE